MNIAFDAKRYFNNTTGLGNYSRSLVNNMAALHSEHNYFLCNPKKTFKYLPPIYNNLQTILPTKMHHKLFTSLWRSNFVLSALKTNNINIYHGLSHEIPIGIGRTNIASVVTMHDLIFELYPNQFKAIDRIIYRQKFKHAAQHANAIIAISTQTKTDLINLYKVPTQKIHVCYQSCSDIFKQPINKLDAFNFLQQHNLPSQYLLYVGSIIERKNVLLILKALVLLPVKKRLPLIIVGKGDYYEKIVRTYISNNNLTKWVIFLNDIIKDGNYIYNHLPYLYQAAQMFIYPSHYEGFGIPLLEAMHSHCPVITSNVSCLPETVGNAGICIAVNNPSLLLENILMLLQNKTLAATMVEKGLIQAAKFSTKNSVNSTINVYKSVW